MFWLRVMQRPDPHEAVGTARAISYAQLLEFLECHTNVAYAAYFRNKANQPPYYAIFSFGSDGSLVIGLSGEEEPEKAAALLMDLQNLFQTIGFWTVEEPPPISEEAFHQRMGVELAST